MDRRAKPVWFAKSARRQGRGQERQAEGEGRRRRRSRGRCPGRRGCRCPARKEGRQGKEVGRSTMATAFIALGSNLGDRAALLLAAVRELNATAGVRVVRLSTFHETDPVGGPAGQARFLNAEIGRAHV